MHACRLCTEDQIGHVVADFGRSVVTVAVFEGVEVCKVGNWHSGLSGRVPITSADLDEMVRASADGEIDGVPLKFGHVDPRFDGEPAAGWLKNVRRVGDTLLADVVEVPDKLAEVIRAGFPRRSAEIAWNVKTPLGRTYGAALAGLALLGVTAPAVKGLADITARYSGAVTTTVVTAVETAVLAGPVQAETDVWLDEFLDTLPGWRPRRR